VESVGYFNEAWTFSMHFASAKREGVNRAKPFPTFQRTSATLYFLLDCGVQFAYKIAKDSGTVEWKEKNHGIEEESDQEREEGQSTAPDQATIL
jgi:hypothetical protein